MIIFVFLILSFADSQNSSVKVTYNYKSYYFEPRDLTVSKLKSLFDISEFEFLEDLSGKTFYPSLYGTFSPSISSELFVRQLSPKSIPTTIYTSESKFMCSHANWNPTYNFDIGPTVNPGMQRVGFIHFKDLSLINKKQKISKVYLRLVGVWQFNNLPVQIFIHRCETDWQGIVTWFQQPIYKEESYSSRIVTETRDIRYSWDVTDIVLDWVSGIHPNYGIAVKANNSWDFLSVKGFYNTDPIKKPCLLVYYSE